MDKYYIDPGHPNTVQSREDSTESYTLVTQEEAYRLMDVLNELSAQADGYLDAITHDEY